MTTSFPWMKWALLLGALLAIFFVHIDTINQLTLLQKALPLLEETYREQRELNGWLLMQWTEKRSPHILLKKLREPRFSHLHFPKEEELITLLAASMPPSRAEKEEARFKDGFPVE